MSDDTTNHAVVPQQTRRELQKSDLAAAGRASNHAAANYLFADYKQRRANSTLRTQRAALVL